MALNHGYIAAKVRKHKDLHPELYCPNKVCLWRTGGGYCPKHDRAPDDSQLQRCGGSVTGNHGESDFYKADKPCVYCGLYKRDVTVGD